MITEQLEHNEVENKQLQIACSTDNSYAVVVFVILVVIMNPDPRNYDIPMRSLINCVLAGY